MSRLCDGLQLCAKDMPDWKYMDLVNAQIIVSRKRNTSEPVWCRIGTR